MRRLLLAALVLTIAGSTAARLAAQSQDPLIVSARQFSQQGHYDTAIAMLRSVLTSRPDDQALRNELADVLLLKQRALTDQLTELRREIASLRGPQGMAVTVAPSQGVRAPISPTWSGMQPVRVGGDIKAPMKVKDVKPVYPLEAQQARIQGIVIVEAVIDTDGTVAEARILRGVPLINDAAIEAVRQWQYTPTTVQGVRVPVIMTVTVTFAMEQSPYFR